MIQRVVVAAGSGKGKEQKNALFLSVPLCFGAFALVLTWGASVLLRFS